MWFARKATNFGSWIPERKRRGKFPSATYREEWRSQPTAANLYVANSWTDTVSVIDAEKLEVVRTLPTGFEPGLRRRSEGEIALRRQPPQQRYFHHRSEQRHETKRLAAGRGASYLALSPDGTLIYCTHIYPNPGAFRTPPESEITVIDTGSQKVVERKAAAQRRGRVPRRAVSRWKAGSGGAASSEESGSSGACGARLGVREFAQFFGEDVGGTVHVPLDELDRYFALPWGVAITPDKSKIFVTTAASESVTVIDVRAAAQLCALAREPFVNDLSASANYVWQGFLSATIRAALCCRKIASGCTWRTGLTTTFPSSTQPRTVVESTIDLGGPKTINPFRRGERIFFTADSLFRASLAAPIAIWMQPLTGCNGILSRTASARILSTIARSRILPAPSPSSGMAAIPICQPSAGRARRSSSSVRRVSAIGNSPTWSLLFTRFLIAPIAIAWQMEN